MSSEFVCPECRAEIQPDLIETTGRAECPFCGADLSSLGLPQPAEEFAGRSTETGEVPEPSQGVLWELPALPEKSRIRVAESTGDRLVLYMPGGGKHAAGLGCFALAWCGFMCIFTPAMGAGLLQGNANGPPLLFIIPFLGLFWAIGLGMAWFWIKMKFERAFLLVERDRVVLQRVLFKRKRVDETRLTRESKAELVESYKQNEKPVYRVEVRGQSGAVKFGTGLGDDDKDWIVDRINEFLGAATTAAQAVPAPGAPGISQLSETPGLPQTCPQCGAPLAERTVEGGVACGQCGAVLRPAGVPSRAEAIENNERLEPADLPADSPMTIDEDSADVLEFHYDACARTPARWIVPLVTLVFSTIWFSGLFGFMAGAWQAPGPAKFGFLLFGIPFGLAGLIPFAAGLVVARGRTRVRLTRESVRCRWNLGPLGLTRVMPTENVQSVRVEFLANAAQNPRVRRPAGPAAAQFPACVVRAGKKSLLLTLFQPEPVARQVAALVRARLNKLGKPAS